MAEKMIESKDAACHAVRKIRIYTYNLHICKQTWNVAKVIWMVMVNFLSNLMAFFLSPSTSRQESLGGRFLFCALSDENSYSIAVFAPTFWLHRFHLLKWYMHRNILQMHLFITKTFLILICSLIYLRQARFMEIVIFEISQAFSQNNLYLKIICALCVCYNVS